MLSVVFKGRKPMILIGQASLFPAGTLEEEMLDLLENKFGGSPVPFSFLYQEMRKRGIDMAPNKIVPALSLLLRQSKVEISDVYLEVEPNGRKWQFGIVVKFKPQKS